MSIEVLPLGMKCSASCKYCYQEPVRDAENAEPPEYDMDAMKAALRDEGWKFTVFGGEPLLVPIMDLAELWRFGYEEMGVKSREKGEGSNGIQTAAIQLNAKHIELMNKYDVGVGVSIDGPGELNDARWFGPTLETTRAATAKAEANLDKMLKELKRKPSIIVTLHKENGTFTRIHKLIRWLKEMNGKGLSYVNVHLLEIDSAEGADLRLSDEETTYAFELLWDLYRTTNLTVQPLADMEKALLNQFQPDKDEKLEDKLSCIWNGCDPMTTEAVRGVGPKGERFNCGRTYKDGVMAIKAESEGFERYLQLYYTPQASGGCAGCRFFYFCKGNCPGTGETGDWRYRTEQCGILMSIFEMIERDLLAIGQKPFSLDERREIVEKMMVEQWKSGGRPQISYTTAAYSRGDTYNNVGLPGHQDIPHGDWHGDSDGTDSIWNMEADDGEEEEETD